MTPILYSFRRCPYAMRARMALLSAGIQVEMREILLRDKPPHMLNISPKGTVPVLLTTTGEVIDESLDIMHWALSQNDPLGLLDMPQEGHSLLEEIDGPFKSALDVYKYAARHQEANPLEQRELASQTLLKMDALLAKNAYLLGETPSLADYGSFTFVRQFANVDRDWFDAQPWEALARWLKTLVEGVEFDAIMTKFDPWKPEDAPILF